MKFRLFILFCYLIGSLSAQVKGKWKGLLIRDGQSMEQASIIYFDFTSSADLFGKSREEVASKNGFALKKLKGSSTKNHLEFKQTVVEKKKDISGIRWCNMVFNLDFIDSTGYLVGQFSSVECRGVQGKVICIPASEWAGSSPTDIELQSWRPILIDDLKKGRKAPELREIDRKNFRFTPIYFDFDQTEIKEEYKPFLISLYKVVSGHSDLRIRVTGHTDAKGSDVYNIDLSERRAKAIIQFFLDAGLTRDRILIDFKGETEPIGDNETIEGQQLNRRVDFSFI